MIAENEVESATIVKLNVEIEMEDILKPENDVKEAADSVVLVSVSYCIE